MRVEELPKNPVFEILMHNLGPQKVTRGNYVTERKGLFKGKSVSFLHKQSQKFNKNKLT